MKALRKIALVLGILAAGAASLEVGYYLVSITPKATIRATEFVHSMAFSPDGRSLAFTAGISDSIVVWDLDRGQGSRTVRLDRGQVGCLGVSPDGTTLAAAVWIENKEHLRMWDVSDSRTHVIPTSPESRIPSWVVRSHSDCGGKYRVTGDDRWYPKRVVITDPRTNQIVSRIAGHPENYINDWLFTKDGDVFITAGGYNSHAWPVNRGGDVRLWDVKTGRRMATLSTSWMLNSHWGAIDTLAISSDGKRLATGGADGLIKLWDLAEIRNRCK